MLTRKEIASMAIQTPMKEELIEFVSSLTEEEVDKIVNRLPELISLLCSLVIYSSFAIKSLEGAIKSLLKVIKSESFWI